MAETGYTIEVEAGKVAPAAGHLEISLTTPRGQRTGRTALIQKGSDSETIVAAVLDLLQSGDEFEDSGLEVKVDSENANKIIVIDPRLEDPETQQIIRVNRPPKFIPRFEMDEGTCIDIAQRLDPEPPLVGSLRFESGGLATGQSCDGPGTSVVRVFINEQEIRVDPGEDRSVESLVKELADETEALGFSVTRDPEGRGFSFWDGSNESPLVSLGFQSDDIGILASEPVQRIGPLSVLEIPTLSIAGLVVFSIAMAALGVLFGGRILR